MKTTFLLTYIFTLISFSSSAFSWFGLFPDEEKDEKEPKRLHILLEKANSIIEEAEDKALEGDADNAIKLYREAIAELERVESENPERAASPEFAPLRNRKATCLGSIETIRFEQIDKNIRSVAVTDTTKLQERWNKKHGVKQKEEKPVAKENTKPVSTAPRAEKKVLPPKPITNSVKDRLAWSLEAIKGKNFLAAEKELQSILKTDASNLQALLLLATAQIGLNSNFAARATLERTIRNHPRSYIAYYNLVSVILLINPKDINSAKQYYEMGRMVGGPKNEGIEKRLNARK